MAAFFIDSSALVKRYINEEGTVWVQSITDAVSGHEIYIARITPVEVIAAIARRTRTRSLDAMMAASAIARFRTDLIQDYRVIELTPVSTERAMTLAELHGLRGYDAVQLASALEVNE